MKSKLIELTRELGYHQRAQCIITRWSLILVVIALPYDVIIEHVSRPLAGLELNLSRKVDLSGLPSGLYFVEVAEWGWRNPLIVR